MKRYIAAATIVAASLIGGAGTAAAVTPPYFGGAVNHASPASYCVTQGVPPHFYTICYPYSPIHIHPLGK
jgi:hypothetical protein